MCLQVSISYWWLVPDGPGNPFVAFVTDLANDSDPPFVNSISYGSIEQVGLFSADMFFPKRLNESR